MGATIRARFTPLPAPFRPHIQPDHHAMLQRLILSVLLAVTAAALPAQAQILIGQTAGHTGAVAATVKEATAGARLLFDALNARGGIGGQKLELVVLDDAFDPQRAADNAKALIDKGVIALFLTRGTPHNQRILPLLAEFKLPLVGPSTGAMALHKPVNRWLFNVRAPYQREAEKAVRYLVNFGATRIGLIQVDDSFGDDAAAGALRAFGSGKPSVHEKYNRDNPDFTPIVRKLVAADVQAVLFLGSGTSVVEGIRTLRSAGSRAQVVTLSNNASAGFVKQLGQWAYGTIFTQVFPSERSMSVPMVKEAADMLRAAGKGDLTPAMLEGFASAKVLVEGLRRAAAAKDLSRNGLQRALEGMTQYDLGGLDLGYGPGDHTGLEFSDLSIVGADGRFKR